MLTDWLGVAEAALEFGATVIISSSRAAKLQDKITELQSLYPSAKDRISGFTCDLADEENLENNVKQLLERAGTLDHIVQTAGDDLGTKTLAEIDMDFVKKAGLVRFFSVLMLAKHAPKHLNPGPKSSITYTSGVVSERPFPGWTVIAAYAAGAHGMARGLALDLKPIRVNVVAPGPVQTQIWDKISPEEQKGYSAALPTGTVGKPADVAESFLYSIRDHNLTGAVIQSDGGARFM
jgi:NAD(P)-dependent dehydrogenase (short-subunit alcohol dehydrogenase family)